eukprot:g9079.t1
MTSIASDAPLTLTVQKIPVPRLHTSVPEANADYGNFRDHSGHSYANYMGEHDYILADICRKRGNDDSSSAKDATPAPENDMQFKRPTASRTIRAFLRAGPRKKLYFDPKGMKAAVVTCGGLCPGLNTVIYHIVSSLNKLYGIHDILGIKGGFHGFYNGVKPIQLTEKLVEGIQHRGGTILGSARGGFDRDKIFEAVKSWNLSIVFVIGGDGTHRGALKLHELAQERKEPISIVGIPKTIDNDIDIIDRSFGFETAIEEARNAINCAKTEAECAPNGVGIVKLMGRHAGFIAVHATLASGDVDLVLIPELPVNVTPGSPSNCLDHVKSVILKKGHAVVVVAEGAGEDLLLREVTGPPAMRRSTTVGSTIHQTNAQGVQPKLPPIGAWIKKRLKTYLKDQNVEATVKYIDPSYMIRSVPANAADNMYCLLLGQNAVHGAMAGYSGFSVALVNNKVVFIPIENLVKNSPRAVNPVGRTMERILSITHQPR